MTIDWYAVIYHRLAHTPGRSLEEELIEAAAGEIVDYRKKLDEDFPNWRDAL